MRLGHAAPDVVGSAELTVDEGTSSVLVTAVLGWPRRVRGAKAKREIQADMLERIPCRSAGDGGVGTSWLVATGDSH